MTTATHPHELVEHIHTLTNREYEEARDTPPAHVVASERTRHADD